jgi:hypothetical protein
MLADVWPFKRKPVKHSAGVYDVRVVGETPYFVALCECGWYGDFHEDQSAGASLALRDAQNHAPDSVLPGVHLRT